MKILCLYIVIKLFSVCGVICLIRIELVGWLFLNILNGINVVIFVVDLFVFLSLVCMVCVDFLKVKVLVCVKKLDISFW